jgi:hypothetical protein
MTKIFKFDNKSNNTIKFNGINGSNSTNYSEILDNIIAADIIKKNKYLFKTADEDLYDTLISDDILIKGNPLKASDDFTKATLFLANYKKYKKTYKLPYILGKMYTLTDGTPIVFYDDEIQIGFDTYRYTDFTDFSFLNGLKASTKKTIINIYTNGTANININL